MGRRASKFSARTEAARRTFIRLVESYGGKEATAGALRCSVSTVTQIMAADRNPGLEIAYGIEQLFGIPMQDWVDPELFAHLKKSSGRAA